jgi:hypothetical protein
MRRLPFVRLYVFLNPLSYIHSAFRQKFLPFGSVLQGRELLGWDCVDYDLLVLAQKAKHVHESTQAFAVPYHEANGCLFRHPLIFCGVILKTPFALRSGYHPYCPIAKVVAALSIGAENLDSFVPSTVKIFLDRLVDAVRVPDDDGKTLFDNPIYAPPHFVVEPRNSPRASNKDLGHDLLRVRVIARA